MSLFVSSWGFAFAFSVHVAFIVHLDSIIRQVGLDPLIMYFCRLAYVISGIIATIVHGLILQKYSKYKKQSLYGILITIIASVGFTTEITFEN